MLYLYDPITNIKKETTYKKISGITGYAVDTLASYKSRRKKLKNINCYLMDDTFSEEEVKTLFQNEVIKDELWKDIEDTNGKYQISSYGRTRVLYKNGKIKILRPYIRKGKWLHVKVTVDKKVKEIAIHKLVAEYFVVNDNPKQNTIVFHESGNIHDNHFRNLTWTNRKSLGKKTGAKSNSVPVVKIDPITGEVLEEYNSMAHAGRENYLHRETIRLCIKDRLKTAGGFKWATATLEVSI
ncbi:MAG: NUMOD4 domain-containing protein [Tepidibacter sp.]|jgi:hypothetical protein|uniref:NUMOD4 domain-containing protein n=1 Tax=Tepidibacter sp. TaxID=2529387 RepID=UPI0025FA8595|nr:NUMOD4 domain-containing protein [Tepidibacter sp.]MCT4507920.1 NUMOD4 domain-containing protein [Tepidibacter sp.]